jgi:hypothetical protein
LSITLLALLAKKLKVMRSFSSLLIVLYYQPQGPYSQRFISFLIAEWAP